jgi:Cu(I)/Ag(I) efflux system membrane fusion protein/cobalt-zinc-cadmium efflux system membrane fusion protein
VQNETRTVKARIEFPNPGLALKPEMYANVLIDTAAVADALAVPENAVLKSGKGQTVFVALGEGKFEPRAVVTGVTNDEGLVQILSGLKDGEEVVTSAQFMLDSESKLREAIEKMLAPKGEMPPAAAKDDLNDLFN